MDGRILRKGRSFRDDLTQASEEGKEGEENNEDYDAYSISLCSENDNEMESFKLREKKNCDFKYF